jgi:hypothetical protein
MPSKKQRAKVRRVDRPADQEPVHESRSELRQPLAFAHAPVDAYMWQLVNQPDPTMCPRCTARGSRVESCDNCTMRLIDPTQGLVRGNIQLVCCFVNGLTAAQVEELAAARDDER